MSVNSKRTRISGGSSSILKKTSSLKKRLSEIVQTPTKVRFQLPYSTKVQLILKEFIENKEPKEYLSLVCLIRDAELLDSDISSLLKEATECISLLNRDLKLFVEALLSINWIERDSEVVKEYQSFIVNLLSAHNYHSFIVIDKLVELFLPDPQDPQWPDGIPTETDRKKCVNVHILINILLAVVPMCKELLLQSLNKQYPYYIKPTHTQEYYLHNLLWILTYQPTFRPDILHLIFIKLIKMDANAPKEEIERLKLKDEEEIFRMDDDLKSVVSDNTAFTIVDRDVLVAALDASMDMIFDYVQRECHHKNGELNWDKTKSLYRDIVAVFDKIILPTYNSHHVQFVMFILCSLKTTLAKGFLNYLWKKACNPNVPVVLRQAAVTYMASLAARGLFISLTMLKETLQEMAEWIHAYIANQDGLECVNSDVRMHAVFYSVCQALFYLVSFRHKELVDSKKNIVFLESLQLGKIVTNRLNPLRVCQSAVVQNFAAITRMYQLAYCYTIIDHNSRNYLPTIYQDDKGSQVISDNLLNTVYPFDPYILERSGKKIHPLYRDYQKETFESNMEVDVMENTEIDDFLESSPELASTRNSCKFSYGSSPGFKFK